MNNEEEVVINKYTIEKYTMNDLDLVLEKSKKNSKGFPKFLPIKDSKGQRILLSFYKATIHSLSGEKLDEEEATFNITEKEIFDKNDPLAQTKIKFLSALFSTNRFVDGGVYYKGEYFTRKMTAKFAKYLTKCFMANYFHYEDGPMLMDYFDKMEGGFLPYYPAKTYDGKNAIFAAINAYVVRATEKDNPTGTINFVVYEGDTFDITNEEDIKKAEVIKALLDSNMIVSGFYYKGALLPESLSKNFKLYLEKTFVKKNFTVDQRDYLFTNVTKDTNTNYPLFWPMKDKDGRVVEISVVNASVNLIGVAEKYSNFDVYADEAFDLSNEEFQIKLQIIQELYSKKSALSGGLYFDGMLIPSNMSRSEVERRKGKVEKALKIYIEDNNDFMKITKEYSIEDRFDLLRLSKSYDNYYPDNIDIVEKKDKSYNPESDVVLKFDRVNVVDEVGKFRLAEEYSKEVKLNEKFDNNENELIIFSELARKDSKVRGGIYYKGVNMTSKRGKLYGEFVNEFLPVYFNAEELANINKEQPERYKFIVDKKNGMPKYWPTKDKDGRETLLSVVDADIHFHIGRRVVRACNNLNFDIYVGETFGLVGESGSGKTTISRAILGINKLTKGGIYFKGKLISGEMNKTEVKNTKKNIQMIFQDPAASLNERANIDYIVSEGLYNFKMFKTTEERLEKVNKMMRNVGLLPEHLSRYPHEFSGGQRQRIGIARALVIEPQLVLADEPISALDVSIRAQVLNLLKKLQQEEDLTYLFIAHDLSIIRYISDRIAVMHQGYIVELGKAEDIYSNPIHPYTKALLTAIPQPDPKTKDSRKKLVYDRGDLDYSKCQWIEVKPEHYVLGTNDLVEKWLKK